MANTVKLLALALVVIIPAPAIAQDEHHPPKVDDRARIVAHDSAAFGGGPHYEGPYDVQAQIDIYGAKYMNPTARPLLELGREMYGAGPLKRGMGTYNPIRPQLLVYGDFRTAAGYNRFGDAGDLGTWGNRLNLDIDLRFTETERVHALFRPFEKDGQFTRFDFTGDSTGFKDNFDFEPTALFFEGDLGAILGGLSGNDSPFDMPIAFGIMPILFHNGTWLEDAFTGAAFTIPAKNSAALDWTNYDITFFAGFDRVSNEFVNTGRIFGVNTFIEAYRGYIEGGYAFVGGEENVSKGYHSVALSFTKRYGGRLSNSVRYIGAFGGSSDTLATIANGHLLLVENSLITSKPTTVVPYLNLFFGLDNPGSAARDPGAGGILKNTGLSFETEAITGFPALNATATDAVGGALGINLLGNNLNQQLVLEAAGSFAHTASAFTPQGAQFAVGFRAQRNLSNTMIARADGVFGKRKDLSDISGLRFELRRKF